MIIDLPPHIEQIIINQAQQQGVSIAELITQKFFHDINHVNKNNFEYPKGDIRRLKGIAKTNIQISPISIDEMNLAIEQGAIHGE